MKKVVVGALGILGKRVIDYLLKVKDIQLIGILTAVDREGQYDCSGFAKKLNLKKTDEDLLLLKPDLYINISYPKIIGDELLKTCLCVNLHSAKLPDYKGRSVYTHAIQNNDATYTTTIHLMEKEVDTGDVIAERIEPIYGYDTAKSLYDRMQDLSYKMFVEEFYSILTNNFSRRKQIGAGRYYKKMLNKEINSHDSPENIYNKVRSLDFPPYEPAYYINDGKKITLTIQDIIFDRLTNRIKFLK